jgi:hypothetical protein
MRSNRSDLIVSAIERSVFRTESTKERSVIMKRSLTICLAGVILLAATPVAQAVVTDLLGDTDGFGVGVPEASGLHYLDYGTYWADYREAGDPTWSDYWFIGDRSWTHSFDTGGVDVASATLDIFVAGIADFNDWSADVKVNDTVIATISGVDGWHDVTRVLSFGVPVALLGGSDTDLLDVSIEGDGYIVDYSRLVVTLVPAPGAILLAGLGVGLVAWFRRKRAF